MRQPRAYPKSRVSRAMRFLAAQRGCMSNWQALHRHGLFPALAMAMLCATQLFSGCSHPAAARAAVGQSSARDSKLVLVNETSAAWQISAVLGDRSVGSWRVLPGATLEVELPAGELRLRQVLLADGSTPGETRAVSLRLVAGQTYHWRLVTLLSSASSDIVIPVTPKGGQ